MPPDDYSSAFAGGALKLKGVQSSKIEKRQKKRKRADPAENHTHSKDVSAALSTAKDEDGNGVAEEGVLDLRAKGTGGGLGKELREGDEDQEEGIAGVGMTEAERRHAESKRKRVRLHFFIAEFSGLRVWVWWSGLIGVLWY